MQYIINTQGKVIMSAQKAGYFHDGQGLCPVQINNKWGYINTDGKIIIPCIYENCWPFEKDTCGTAKVKQNGKYGLINKEGKTIVPFQYDSYDSVPIPHDGIICIKISETADEKRTYKCIDTNGNHLFTMKALVDIEFSEGLARVWKSDEEGYGVVDKKGDFIIPTSQYDFISDYHFGVARVQKDGKHGYINKTGKIVVDIKYDSISDNNWNPIARVFVEGKFGYIDKRNGVQITPILFEEDSRNVYEQYSDKMSIIRTGNDIYVYNTEECKSYKLTKYNDIGRFSNGLCAVEQSGKIGFIDKQCNLVIPCKFDKPDRNSLYVYLFKGETCAMDHSIIDRQGNAVRVIPDGWRPKPIPPGHESNVFLYHLYTKKAGPCEAMLFNLKGEHIFTAMEFDAHAHHFFPIAAQNKQDGKWGFVSENGRLVVSYQFEEPYFFEDGFATIDEPIRSSGNRGSSNNSAPSGSNNSGGCYIATAVYGSYNCPEVWTLRRYRDNVLDNTWYGRLFIRSYYAISPTLVKWFGKSNWFKNLLINPLNNKVKKLNKKGFENTPYEDKY